jgi:anti-sigma-K factor RskA
VDSHRGRCFEKGVDLSTQHPISEQDLELLALGVVAGEDCQSLRAHIASCAECSRQFAEAQGRIALFALAAPPQAPPASARVRLLEKIHAENPAPLAGAHSRAMRTAPRWWNSIWAPATAVLAVATVLLWTNDRRLSKQVDDLQKTEDHYNDVARQEQALVSMLSAGDTKAVELTATRKVSKDAWALVRYNSRMGMICYNGDLPAPPPHKEYQLWVVPEVGDPISVGAFMPASFSKGRMCMAKLPEGVSCQSFGVTLEPMGGVPHPSGPIVLSGGTE